MSDSNQLKLYYTVAEAAQVSGIPKWKLYEVIKKGFLKTYKVLNNRNYVKLEDIKNLIEEGGSYE